MTSIPHFDLSYCQVHITKDDCSAIIRAQNGVAFYCELHAS